MNGIKKLCLAAAVLAVTGIASPAFAFDNDESACFSYRSPSGIIKMCAGDMDRDRDRGRRDYGYRERVYYEPVAYHYYYGTPVQYAHHHRHHNKHHNKHHKHCDHGRHGHGHD